MKRFVGRPAIITGASGGIGAATPVDCQCSPRTQSPTEIRAIGLGPLIIQWHDTDEHDATGRRVQAKEHPCGFLQARAYDLAHCE